MNIWLSENFYSNRKTIRLLRDLGGDAIVSLQKLWLYARRYAVDNLLDDDQIGILKDFDELDIELISEWKKESGVFFESLKSLKLIEKRKGQYFIHDFLDNNPQVSVLIKQKINGSRYAKKRWEQKKIGDPIGDPLSTPEGDPIAREEKRREEKRSNKEKSIKKKVNAKRDYIPYEKIVEHYNKTFGAHRLPDTAATIGHINNAWEYALKRPDYKDNPEEAFYKVHENVAEKCKKDPSQLEWSKPENIYRMGARSSNFENHLNQLKEKPVDLGRFGSDSQ